MSNTSMPELREQIVRTIAFGRADGHSAGVVGDDIVTLIEAHYSQNEREARIDELKNRLKVQFTPYQWQRLRDETNSWAAYVDRRLAQLSPIQTIGDKGEKQSLLNRKGDV